MSLIPIDLISIREEIKRMQAEIEQLQLVVLNLANQVADQIDKGKSDL